MIWQMIEDWFRGILTDGILSNLSGLFDSVNTEVGEIATQVGTTPRRVERGHIQHDTQPFGKRHCTDCGRYHYLCHVL